MKRIAALIFTAAIVVLLAIGCGSDGDKQITGNKDTTFVTGNPNDGTLLFAKEFINSDESFTGLGYGMELTMELLGEQFGGFSKAAVNNGLSVSSDSVVFDTANFSYTVSPDNWHIFTFVISVFDNQIWLEFEGIDSAKVFKGGAVMANPDSTFDAVNIRAHLQINAADTIFDLHLAAHHAINIASVNLADSTDIFNLSGSGADSIFANVSTDTTDCMMTVSQNTTAQNIAMITKGGDCPLSGSANVVAGFAFECTSGNLESGYSAAEGVWSADFVFSGSSVSVVYKNGNTKWTATEPCQSGTAKHWWETEVR